LDGCDLTSSTQYKLYHAVKGMVQLKNEITVMKKLENIT